MDEGRALSAAPLRDWAPDPAAELGHDGAPDGERTFGLASPLPEADGAGADHGAAIAAALVAARDAEHDRAERLQRKLRRLEGSNRSLRRTLLSLRMLRWRDEDAIERLERELAAVREARDNAIMCGRRLAYEVGLPRPARSGRRAGASEIRRFGGAASDRRPVLPGSDPFFRRGFQLGEGTAIVGASVHRARHAPPGAMVFGPYIKLPPGIYAIEVDAHLFRLLPVFANFTLDAVRDGGRQIVAQRGFRLCSAKRRRCFELVFAVWEGEDYADYEFRVWATGGTALAIGRIELYQLS